LVYFSLIGLAVAIVCVWIFAPLATTDKVGITTAASMVALVILTAIYAWHTRKMANEMRKQRYSDSLPLLIPTIIPQWNTQGLDLKEVPYPYLQTGTGIKVMWRNLGSGVAINSRFSLWTASLDSSPGQALFLPPLESESLGVGEQKEINFHEAWQGKKIDIPAGHHPRLEAEYQDIYERQVTTVQEFRIEEQKDNKRAFLGELYFTIDGRRLGTEVEHD
jgi:hypothetical protein